MLIGHSHSSHEPGTVIPIAIVGPAGEPSEIRWRAGQVVSPFPLEALRFLSGLKECQDHHRQHDKSKARGRPATDCTIIEVPGSTTALLSEERFPVFLNSAHGGDSASRFLPGLPRVSTGSACPASAKVNLLEGHPGIHAHDRPLNSTADLGETQRRPRVSV